MLIKSGDWFLDRVINYLFNVVDVDGRRGTIYCRVYSLRNGILADITDDYLVDKRKNAAPFPEFMFESCKRLDSSRDLEALLTYLI